MKNNKGITLLALIITIIVLVILAGVALNTLFGNRKRGNSISICGFKNEVIYR